MYIYNAQLRILLDKLRYDAVNITRTGLNNSVVYDKVTVLRSIRNFCRFINQPNHMFTIQQLKVVKL